MTTIGPETLTELMDAHGGTRVFVAFPLSYIIDREGNVVDAWFNHEHGHLRAKAALQKPGKPDHDPAFGKYVLPHHDRIEELWGYQTDLLGRR
jgi:hypothetical protein